MAETEVSIAIVVIETIKRLTSVLLGPWECIAIQCGTLVQNGYIIDHMKSVICERSRVRVIICRRYFLVYEY